MKNLDQMYLPEVYQRVGFTQTAATTRVAMRESKKALKRKMMTGKQNVNCEGMNCARKEGALTMH